MDRNAYNNFTMSETPYKEIPEKEWQQLAQRVEISFLHSKRLGGQQSSVNAEIDKVTADWTLSERERFRRWYKHTRARKASVGPSMQKVAEYYAPYGSSQAKEEFDKTRKSLTRRLRKLQNEISEFYNNTHKNMQWADQPGTGSFPTGDGKVAAILNALNHVCTLLSTLRTKEVTAAALIRTANILEKIDPKTARQYRDIIGTRNDMLRVARSAEVAALAKELKQEMDVFHYGTHLRRLYQIYDKLGRLGLTSATVELESVIQKDLPDITSLYKKLSEIYVSLVELPSETAKPAASTGPTPMAPPTPATQNQFQTLDNPRKENIPAAGI